jgi:hypothetical protein
MDDLAGCATSWEDLLALGVARLDLGIVAASDAIARADVGFGDADGEGVAGSAWIWIAHSIVEMVPLARAGGGPSMHASCAYPSQLIARAMDGAGLARAPFAGLLPLRDGAALDLAIARGGAAIWVRSADPDTASLAVSLLLQQSRERVRTITRQTSGGS